MTGSEDPAADDYEEEFEGSLKSYLVVLGSFSIHFLLLGWMYVFGVYQEEFVSSFNAPNADVAWVGTLLTCGLIILGPLTGGLGDRFGFRVLSLVGSSIFCCALIGASFSTELWQVVVLMGIVASCGMSLAYYPAVAVVSHWWVRRRGAANGVAVAGAGVGGLVFGPLSQILIDEYGWEMALRITAAVCAPFLFFSSLCIIARTAKPKTKSPAENGHQTTTLLEEPTRKHSLFRELFCNRQFFFLFWASFCEGFGYYIPFFYVTSYAVDQGSSKSFGALVLGLMNGSSGVGRIVLGRIGDSYGYLHCFIYCMSVSTASLFLWMLCTTEWSIVIFSIIFGFHVGGYISLQAPMMATLFGTKDLAAVMGYLYSGGIPGILVGPVIAGYITDQYEPDYKPTISFSAGTYAALVLLLIPVYFEHRRLKKGETQTLLSDSEYVVVDDFASTLDGGSSSASES